MFKNFCVLVLVSAAVISCSSTKSVYFEEGITKNSIKEPFHVVAIDNRWVEGASSAALPTQLRNIFYDQLDNAFSNATPVPFETADHDDPKFDGKFKVSKLASGNNELEVYLASKEVLESLDKRYILFLENYEFSVKVNPSSGGGYAGMETEALRTITFTSEFYVWDKEQNRAINWGKIKEESQVRNTPQESDYRELLTKSAASLLQKSPISVYP